MGDQVQGLFGDLGAMYDAAAAKAADNSFTNDVWGLSAEVSTADTSRQAVANPRNDWSSFWQGQIQTIVGAGVQSLGAQSAPGGQAGQGGGIPQTSVTPQQQVRGFGGINPLMLAALALVGYLIVKKA